MLMAFLIKRIYLSSYFSEMNRVPIQISCLCFPADFTFKRKKAPDPTVLDQIFLREIPLVLASNLPHLIYR